MDSVRQYVLSVICMVIVCGVMQMFFQTGSTASLVKLLSGMIVTIAVLNPLLQEKILKWDVQFESLSLDGELAVAEGKIEAENVLAELIKEKTQTYILTKAAELGADVTVAVELQEEYPNAPESVTVSGTVSPYAKQQLTVWLQQDLGIAEEDQIWIS